MTSEPDSADDDDREMTADEIVEMKRGWRRYQREWHVNRTEVFPINRAGDEWKAPRDMTIAEALQALEIVTTASDMPDDVDHARSIYARRHRLIRMLRKLGEQRWGEGEPELLATLQRRENWWLWFEYRETCHNHG